MGSPGVNPNQPARLGGLALNEMTVDVRRESETRQLFTLPAMKRAGGAWSPATQSCGFDIFSLLEFRDFVCLSKLSSRVSQSAKAASEGSKSSGAPWA